jgi:hypothetical protein
MKRKSGRDISIGANAYSMERRTYEIKKDEYLVMDG